jgi:hypothetical protein
MRENFMFVQNGRQSEGDGGGEFFFVVNFSFIFVFE